MTILATRAGPIPGSAVAAEFPRGSLQSCTRARVHASLRRGAHDSDAGTAGIPPGQATVLAIAFGSERLTVPVSSAKT